MTVRELRAHLECLPSESTVMIPGTDTDDCADATRHLFRPVNVLTVDDRHVWFDSTKKVAVHVPSVVESL